MEIGLGVTLIATLIAVASAVYARGQAASAAAQVQEAKKANSIAESQLQEAKKSNENAEHQLRILIDESNQLNAINFRFQPRRQNYSDYLDIFNDSPHDAYILWVQLSGPDVNNKYNGVRFNNVSEVGSTEFIRARETRQLLDADGSPGRGGQSLMPHDTQCNLIVLIKANNEYFEIRTDLSLSSERGFSTINTQTIKQ